MSTCHYTILDEEQDISENKVNCKSQNLIPIIEHNERRNFVIGATLLFICAISVCLEAEAVKFAYKNNEHLNTNDFILLSTPLVLIYIFITDYFMNIDLKMINLKAVKWISIRSISSIGYISSVFSAIKYLPASKVLFIKNLHPLFVAACGFCLMKEKVNKYDIMSLIGAFLGTIVMNITKTDSQSNELSSYEALIGISLSIVATFCTCISIISIRITNLNIHYLVGATYYKVLLFIIFLGLFLIFPSLFNSSEYSVSDVIYLNVAGFFHFCALIFQAASYHYCEISKVTVMNYFSGIFAFIIDLLVFKYDFTTTDIIGMLIVILFLFAPALYQMKNKMVHK